MEKMKVVILAGGYGTRISEESHLRPKPMVEIGDRPILWHIMKLYSHYGFNDFVICLGYKGHVIKEYFANYYLGESEVTFDFRDRNFQDIHAHSAEPWRVTLVNTGVETMTGGRLKRIQRHIGNSSFLMTYGDGLADIDMKALVQFHRKHGKLATVTAVQPPGRFGVLAFDPAEASAVVGFNEKAKGDESWINGGFFVLEPGIFDFIEDDRTMWERTSMSRLASEGHLRAYKHEGYWQPMDTLREKTLLEDLWKTGKAPWRLWRNSGEV